MIAKSLGQTISHGILEPIVDNLGRSEHLDAFFFVLSEIQLAFMILSISFTNSFTYNDHESLDPALIPNLDLFFSLEYTSDLSIMKISVFIAYFAVLILFLLIVSFFKASQSWKSAYAGLLTIHKDFIGTIIHYTLCFSIERNKLSPIKIGTAIALNFVNLSFWLFSSQFACNRFHHDSRFGVRTTNVNFINFTYKTLDVIFSSFIDRSIKESLRLVWTAIYLIFCFFLINKFPFYQINTLISFTFLKTIQASIFISVLIRMVAEQSINFTIFICLVISCLLLPAIRFLLLRKIESIFQQNESKIEKPDDMRIMLSVLDYIYKKGSWISPANNFDRNYLLLLSKLSTYDGNLNFFNIIQLEASYKQLIDKIFELVAERFIDDPELIMLKFNFDLHNGKSITYDSIVHLTKLQANQDIVTRIISQKILSKIHLSLTQQNESDHDGTNLDINKMANYFDQKNYFSKLIKKSIKNYIDYWESYIMKSKAYPLFKKSLIINRDAKLIERCWNELSSMNHNNLYSETELYMSYLQAIRIEPIKVIKLGRSLRQQHAKTDFSNKRENDHITVLCLYKSETDLKIMSTSNEISELGFTEEELIGKHLESLVSGMSEQKNILKMMECSSKGRLIFLKDATGYIVPKKYVISPIIHSESLCFMLLFSQPDITGEFLIVSKDGNIFAASKHVSAKLDLNISSLQAKSIIDIFDVNLEILNMEASQNPPVENIRVLDDIKISSEMEFADSAWRISLLNTADKNWKVVHLLPIKAKKIATSVLIKSKKKTHQEYFSECNESVRLENLQHTSVTPAEVDLTLQLNEDKENFRKVFYTSSSSGENSPHQYENKQAREISVATTHHSIASETDLIARIVNRPDKSDNLKGFKYYLFAQIIISILLLIGYVFLAEDSLEIVTSIFSLTKHLFNRSFFLWIWSYWNSEIFLLYKKGLMDTRIGMTKEEYYNFCMGTQITNAISLDQILSNITILYPQFEPEIQRRFLRPIRINPREKSSELRVVNIFEWDKAYISSLIRMYRFYFLPYNAIAIDDPDLFFTSKNILDDHLIVQDDLQNAVRDDIEFKLDNLNGTINYFLGIIIVLAVFLILWAIKQEYLVYQYKKEFLDAMYQIKDDEIRAELSRVTSIYDVVVTSRERRTERLTTRVKNGKQKHIPKSFGNFSKIVIILMLTLILIELLVTLVSVGISITLTSSINEINLIVRDSVKLNNIFDQFGVLFISLFEYLQGNNPTLRNQEYSSQFDIGLNLISTSSNFYYSLLDRLDPDLREAVKPLYRGDLCELAIGDESLCFGEVRGRMKNELIAANSLMINSITTIKNAYDESNKSDAAVFDILYMPEFIDLEFAYWFYVPPATGKIQDAMYEQVIRTIEGSRSTLETMIFVIVIGYVVFFVIIWRSLWSKLIKERMMVNSMIKMIPQNVATNNFYIKNFILKLSKRR